MLPDDQRTFAAACVNEIMEPLSTAALTDDTCVVQFIEIVPLTTNPANDPCTSEDDGGQVKQRVLQPTNQDPDDIQLLRVRCVVTFIICLIAIA